ncbi:type I glyceraldehyde-3-phosphate dehydrogenase [Candidatus Woesearchaeota archaeon]|nr:type I glyceraldehyde-3-phosphate dehydrogenase [Candidatus Woesearchaeota archaeon]
MYIMNVAINGFGRIGRLVFKNILEEKGIKVVAINDLTDTATLSHLLANDSVHGKIKQKVSCDDKCIIVDGKKIHVFAEKDPESLPWKKMKVDVVIESTGRFLTRDLASKHIKAGAKKVILSAPAKDPSIKTVVIGVNEKSLTKKDDIVSNASCTTNSIAPIIKIINDKFGIKSGLLTTIHSYTADQRLVDAPHKDLRRARSAAINIVPTTTGAAKAVSLVIPEMKGKLDGRAVRVPTPNGSITDLSVTLKKKVSVDDVNKAIKRASSSKMKGIIEYSDFDLVSTDIIGNKHSAIYDSKLTQVQDNMIKIFSWYDNEAGYSRRVVDLIKLLKL